MDRSAPPDTQQRHDQVDGLAHQQGDGVTGRHRRPVPRPSMNITGSAALVTGVLGRKGPHDLDLF
ncbi:hypothetical protein [Streptomyces sp. NPDC056821]|uniref:hypothetical protein n=1 Tax=unclassified Streptomyces TaxID=2593676 RepID=UPI0036A09D6A